MIKASIYSAFTTVITFFIVGFIQNPSFIEIDMNLVTGIFIAGIFVWVLGFIFCIVLLFFLMPVFQRVPLGFSLLLFSLVGFCVTAYLGYLFSTISAHGETSAIYQEDNAHAILSIFYIGFIGALSAISAWYSLKNDTVDTNA